MPRTGRPRKPTAVLEMSGTRRPHRHGRKETDVNFPTGAKCPPWLGRHGKAAWRKVAAHLESVGLLSAVDEAALAGYCEAHDEMRKAMNVIKREGIVAYSETGAVYQHPAVGVKNRALERILKFAREFGMTPSSRSNLRVPAKEDNDPFEAYMNARMG